MNSVLKMMNSVLKMMDYVLNMMDYVLKMSNYVLKMSNFEGTLVQGRQHQATCPRVVRSHPLCMYIHAGA